ncbi:uncharacterized protein [Physcomitrium patens]|uniref:EXPERA domain-containing protein n=1 Tax=Physcomitrium patens TaxID=3218 RepID=A0A2K1JPG1_PHYPA|nr:sigma intracellular receptor 2-like isoform X1 [Physcomitrium patens]PNR43422.1 hypothetical protein PHYPA_015803 [Physcomitrium patens]|eukprot:XP_024391245.1 sigma intracellular receptor 2-like isoform X1 [Physcomitrella patens]
MAEARRPVPLSRRPVDLFLAMFLLSNVPVVVLFESQMLLPASLVFKPLRDMTQAYVEFAGDYLVQTAPAFLKGLVVAECLFQLPLSIVNAYAFMAGKDWGRITGIIYASHVATTMFPILADILAHNIPTKNLLLSIYLPYLIIPFIILARLVPTQHPFTEAGPPSIAKKGD